MGLRGENGHSFKQPQMHLLWEGSARTWGWINAIRPCSLALAPKRLGGNDGRKKSCNLMGLSPHVMAAEDWDLRWLAASWSC